MTEKTELAKRKEIRLKDFDYSTFGTYFITICTVDKQELLGTVEGNPMGHTYCRLSEYGSIVEQAINNIAKKYELADVDKYVIMPDHIHLLITIYGNEPGHNFQPPSVATVVNQFKGYVSKQVGFSIWQKLYFDHIIRNQKDYDEIWQYIDENPKMWLLKHKK